MAISFIDEETTDVGTAGDITVSVPALTQDGDVMLAFYWCIDDATTAVDLSGWESIHFLSDGTTFGLVVGAWYRVASSEPASYDFANTGATSNVTAATILTFRGVDTSTPLDVTFVEANHWVKHQNDTSPLPKPITTQTDGAWVVIWSHTSGSTTITDVVPPSGYTERSQILAGNRYQATSTLPVATAGTETPGDITLTDNGGGEDSNIYTLALRPFVASVAASVVLKRHRGH